MIHTKNYKVYYEDTDAGGGVYYANYLKFLERGRSDFLASVGISQVELGKLGVFFVVKMCNVEYFASAILEDDVCVCSKMTQIGKVSIEFTQEIKVLEKACVQAFVKIACVKLVDGIFKPMAIPVEVLERIKLLQK